MRPSAAFLVLLLFLFLAGSIGCAAEGGDDQVKTEGLRSSGEVRRPVVAGAFYPGDPDALAQDIDRYLREAEVPKLAGELVAIISPHAGYMYSGGVAAYGYSYLKSQRFDSVIVVAPSHRFPFRGASVYSGDGYMTPLGTVPIDRELAGAIAASTAGVGYEPMAHSGEHSLEVQVPFLQRTLSDFEIVPIVMGGQSRKDVLALAEGISTAIRAAAAGGKRVLLVASTDLSHYHDYDTATSLDARVIERVGAFDPEGLIEEIAEGRCEACGAGPMATVMVAARGLGADVARVVKYANSGDVTGDRGQVVGYMSAVLARTQVDTPSGSGRRAGADGGAPGPGSSDEGAAASGRGEDTDARPYEGLTDEERRALLTLARTRIEAELGRGSVVEPARESSSLMADCGAFVTIHKKGQLRGCIGYVRAVKPLRDAVADMALQAAFHDPRFPPVSETELDDIDIEISVLSPLVQVGDVSEIEVGRHGLIIQDGIRSGLLLPQVPVEQGWNRETFLEHTCLKAGLPTDSWKRDGVVILKFTAEVFGELELGMRS